MASEIAASEIAASEIAGNSSLEIKSNSVYQGFRAIII